MKVLYIHTYYKYRGGEDIVVESEMEIMKRFGWTISSLIFKNERLSAFKFILAPFNPISFFKVVFSIYKFRPEIVHLHNWSFNASPSVIWAVKLMKLPLVHTIHNFRIICPSATLSYKQNIYLKSIERFFPWHGIFKGIYKGSRIATFWLAFITRVNYLIGTWRKIDRYVVLTEQSKEILERSFLGIKSSTIVIKPNFVERIPKLNQYPRTANFLYIGRLSEEKGLKVLLDAFSDGKHTLKIIGDGPLLPVLKEFLKSNQNVTYLGFCNKDEILKELEFCTALIFPSICIETFGMSIIEAFSCGTPVLASKIGSARDLIKDNINGLHFESGNVENLRLIVNRWISMDVSVKTWFSHNALTEYKEKYTAELNFRQLSSIYNSLIYTNHEYDYIE